MTYGGLNPGGGKIHSSYWPCGPANLLNNAYLVSFLEVNWLCVVWQPPFSSWFQAQELVQLYLLTPLYQWWHVSIDLFPYLSVLASQEWYDVRSVGSEKPQLCSTLDAMLKVLSHLVKLQCESHCASLGLLVLSATEVFSCCVSKKVICPCVYTVVVQIFVSFILQCKFVCKVQDDLFRRFMNFEKTC